MREDKVRSANAEVRNRCAAHLARRTRPDTRGGVRGVVRDHGILVSEQRFHGGQIVFAADITQHDQERVSRSAGMGPARNFSSRVRAARVFHGQTSRQVSQP